MTWSLLLSLLLAGTPADAPLPPAVAEALAKAPQGTRIGLVVVDAQGHEIVALRPDERFVPASNTKLFTTAAAFATLDVAVPDASGGARRKKVRVSSVRNFGEAHIYIGRGS